MAIKITPPVTLATALSGGNVSGGTDLIISAGDVLLVTDQMSVGGITAPASSSSIDLKSTTSALLLNRLTTIQRDALAATAGMVIFNTDTNGLEIFDGVAWTSTMGDIEGPAASTDNALARFDGTTGKIIQNSLGILSDLGALTGLTSLEVNGQVKITGGAPGLDKVLTSDASGLGTWKVLPPDGPGTAIFAQLSSNVDQEPTVTTPVVITYDVQDTISGITHSTTVNPGEITIDTAGVYFINAQPQVGKDSGGSAQTFGLFLQVDRGSGFVNEPNSNIKLTIRDNTDTDVIASGIVISLAVGDKVRMMQAVTSTSVGLGIKFTAAEVGPPAIPETPSIIFAMFMAGI